MATSHTSLGRVPAALEPASGLGTLLPPDGVAPKPLTISTNGGLGGPGGPDYRKRHEAESGL